MEISGDILNPAGVERDYPDGLNQWRTYAHNVELHPPILCFEDIPAELIKFFLARATNLYKRPKTRRNHTLPCTTTILQLHSEK